MTHAAKPVLSAQDDTRPVMALIDPKWNFELENFDVERFFEEAKVTQESIAVLRVRFDKFCSVGEMVKGESDESHLTFEDFRRLNEHYSVCKRKEDEEHYFRAMARSDRQQLSFQDFLLGCSAANPSTPHILNSFTGYVRARYIFDFYNVSGSGTLEYNELAQMLLDARRHLDEGEEALRQLTKDVAQELGDVSVITLHVNDGSAPLCSVRVSTRWTGLGIRREIAKQLKLPVEGQDIVIGQCSLREKEVLMDILPPDGATSASATLVHSQWGAWPTTLSPMASDDVVGLERLVHVTFQRLYNSLVNEHLRGTSRLFRFHRSILHSKAQDGGGALGGA